MNLNMDIEKLVETEIKNQVKTTVENKMKDLTMKKLNNMGYDVKHMIEDIIRKEVRQQLDITNFINKVSKEEIMNRTAELFKEEIFDAIDQRDSRYYY